MTKIVLIVTLDHDDAEMTAILQLLLQRVVKPHVVDRVEKVEWQIYYDVEPKL